MVEGGCYVVAPRQDDKEEQHWGKNESFVWQKLKANHISNQKKKTFDIHQHDIKSSSKGHLIDFKIVLKLYYGTQIVI